MFGKKTDNFHSNVLYNKKFDIQPELLRGFTYAYFCWKPSIIITTLALYNQQHWSLQKNSKVDFGILVWKTDWFWVVFATKIGISISKLAIKKEFDNSKCLAAYADIDFGLIF